MLNHDINEIYHHPKTGKSYVLQARGKKTDPDKRRVLRSDGGRLIEIGEVKTTTSDTVALSDIIEALETAASNGAKTARRI